MNSTRIRMHKLNFHEQPHQLDSTRIVLRRFNNSSNYCCMLSNYGNAWNWVFGKLYKQKFHIVHNPGLITRYKDGASYINITTDLTYFGSGRGSKRELLHRCVATVWVRVPRKLARLNIKLQIDHRNGNRYDNRPCNLRWCTASQNIRYAFRARKGLSV